MVAASGNMSRTDCILWLTGFTRYRKIDGNVVGKDFRIRKKLLLEKVHM